MGIPKFFRWMSTKYPGLHVMARPGQLPEVDNFYLDMNGIIHNCSHPCDGDVHFRITEAEMFEDIFNYIEQLFRIIKPRKVFFMAVDGVAPRAKMNQQRGRRFRSAKEASDREEAAIKKGDILPSEKRFDSNCITPGTEFMVKLNKGLNEFIIKKLTNDREWQKVKVILSGHETPGEGEHKVMDFIRYQRSQPGYDIRTRHCLYGLDTDLIMLGLSSHEPNFTLLREEIKLNRKSNDNKKPRSGRVDPTKIEFNVLFLDRLRENLEQDFRKLECKLQFKFDLESIIDDWIMICFLVGNDFIPHIPHFHIHKDALPTIFGVYQAILPKLDGYINENGILNFKRFRMLAKALAKVDFENYQTLLKENGGECAKDDFTKLNTFVRQKLRISGINQNGGSRYQRSPYNKNNDRTSTHHSHYHQTNDWYKLQSKNNRHTTANNGVAKFNHVEKRELHTSLNNSSPQVQRNNQSKPHGLVTNGHSRPSNGTTNGNNSKVGVHSFTEAQINNSITLCADGDFLDLSDEEFLSDEKFPGEPARKSHPPGRNSSTHNHYQANNNSVTVIRRGDSVRKSNGGGRMDVKSIKQRPSADDYEDFNNYKKAYYKEKLNIDPTPENIGKVVQEYVRALQWNLHYYYHGCKSWGWYYPYHYAPFISDVMNFRDVDTQFEMGEPFKPFDQLLSVLPAASSTLLPKMYRNLVTSQDSPLAKYFPTEVEFDLNGKQNDWEAVVLAPFIDEDALLKASVVYNLFLTPHEQEVNNHGPHLMFYYEPARNLKAKDAKDGRNGRQQLSASVGQVKCVQIDKNGFLLPVEQIKFGLLTPNEGMKDEKIKQKDNNKTSKKSIRAEN